MRTTREAAHAHRLAWVMVMVMTAATARMAESATVWTGPRVTRGNTDGPDPITTNVWITRDMTQGIYNSKQEADFTHYLSPLDTEWANGTTADYDTLSYTDWTTWARDLHGGPPNTVGVDAVLHLKTDDIYMDIKFLSWGSANGVYSYERSTPTVIADPIPEPIPKGAVAVELHTVADGMAAPLGMAVPDDGSGRMFVYDQNGLVWVVLTNTVRLVTPLLDIRDRLVLLGAYDERGLLGLAVHPGFTANPKIYTYTSEPVDGSADFPADVVNHQSILAEWSLDSATDNIANHSTRREILRIDQPQSNHNGGALRFGPDGYLYVALGDGGGANDVGAGHADGGNAQSLDTVLGKLLRIAPGGTNSANGQYGIPPDNPFVGQAGLDEIYAYGLRNPFSFSFDSMTGELYLGDVGQNHIEEVNLIVKGGNYGWNIKEGSFWFDASTGNVVSDPVGTVPPDLVDPIAEYDHDDGLVVIVGHVYRGGELPELADRFVFGDWGSFAAPGGRLFYLDPTNIIRELRIGADDRRLGMWIRGFGEGPDGELYVFGSRVLGPGGASGRMMRIVPVPDPMRIETLAAENGDAVVLSWDGGGGPFSVQKKVRLTDLLWQHAVLSAEPDVSIPRDTPSGFFRTHDGIGTHRIPLTASMSGALERPVPTASPGTGSAVLALDGSTLTFSIVYHGLSATATAAHIHGPARATEAAGVLIDLQPYHVGAFGTSGVFTGISVLTDAQRAMIMDGRTYVNVHTVPYPAGEIRGQIAPVSMTADLHPANEVPPVSGPGDGLATLTLVTTQLTFNVTYAGLSGAATAAHIHGPAGAAANAGVMVDLAPYNGGVYGVSGSLSGTVGLSPAQLAAVVDGLTYINFHTAAHPAGELRGQIRPQVTAVPLTTQMSGAFERPTPVMSDGTGTGTFALEGRRLTFDIAYSGLTATGTAAHIHGPATTAQAAGVLVDLEPFHSGSFGTSGGFSGSVLLTHSQRDAMLGGMTYVNVHTTTYPAGEIRGQIAPVLMMTWLSGVNERPTSIATPGDGTGAFALVRDRLHLSVAYRDLKSAAVSAHIHGPASLLGTAGVLVDLEPFNGGAFGVAGALAGETVLSGPSMLHLMDRATYLNIHTTNHPAGEIRGQLIQ